MSTIKSTLYLKKPKSESKTLIMFQCHFKQEEKRFFYSTGEQIEPKFWDFENRRAKTRGSNRSPLANSINQQIDRYTVKFEEIQARCKAVNEDFTSQILRDAFDIEFKRSPSGKNLFFKAYDEFMDEKKKLGEWSYNTVRRYLNVKGILEEFESKRNYKLTFKSINSKFHAEFTDFCTREKEHGINTFRRNLGLLKTFMLWAYKKNYTYRDDFKEFKRPQPVISSKVALKSEDLAKLMEHKFKSERLERVRDVFVFACSTGMRFGELKLIGKQNVIDGNIELKEEKSDRKKVRKIPLNMLSRMILRKYDYKLPLIANQKQNAYIKEVFEEAGYTHEVENSIVKLNETIRQKVPFYQLISTHTARRTFITMMKRKGKGDKLIAEITGHQDIGTLNLYYQVENEETKEAVSDVFDDIINPLSVAK